MNLFTPIRRFFGTVTMIHKIIYIHYYDLLLKRKSKWIGRRVYGISILPDAVLLLGTLLAAPEKNGYIHLEHTWQAIIIYTLWGWSFLGMAIPLNFGSDGKEAKMRKEVKKELRERPLYWKRMITVYLAAIVAAVVAVNIVM